MVLLVQRRIFGLESLSVESIVFWLLGDWGDEIVLFGDVDGFLDLLRRPL